MKMYRVSPWDGIVEHQVERVTEKTVTYTPKNWNRPTREAMSSAYHSWHKTRADAIRHLLDKATRRMDAAGTEMQAAIEQIAKFYEMLDAESAADKQKA